MNHLTMTSFHMICLMLLVLKDTLHTLAACPSEWITYGSRCHKIMSQNTSFAHALEARKLCQSLGADMTSFQDFDEQISIYSQINRTVPVPSDVYFGLTDISSANIYSWLDTSMAYNYSNFSTPYDENSTRHQADRCVALHSPDDSWSNDTSSWMRTPCCFNTGVKAVACTKPDNGNATISGTVLEDHCNAVCPTGWYHISGKCYKAVSIGSTANNTHEASTKCQSVGGELANPDTEVLIYQMTRIMDEIDEYTRPTSTYIGINNLTNSGNFTTMAGSSLMDTSNILSQNYIPDTDQCATLNSTSRAWMSGSVTYQPIDCCADQNVEWTICEREIAGPTTPMSDDDNPFAVKCFNAINECDSSPCQNGATCVDMVLQYNCSCPVGYTGVNCETEIDYCSPTPCQNGGTCTTQGNNFECNCASAYSGPRCETVIDQCVSNPCQNGATCADGDEHYNCTCINGFVGVNCETNVDDCVNVTCMNNGTCDDLVADHKCVCGTKYTGTLCETMISCHPSDPEVGNATVSRTGTNTAGDQITYTCFEGMKFSDMKPNKTITCLASSSWNIPAADLGSCGRHCAPIPTIENTRVENPSTRIGSNVNFTCLVGYRFPDNSTTVNMTCMENGNWSLNFSEVNSCDIIKCPELPVWPNEELDTWNNTYDTTVTFWCDVGYELHDHTTARTIRCKADGEWTAPLPPCKPVKCPEINPPSSWHINRNTANNTYGTYVHYDCEDNRRMLDGSTFRVIKCDATGEWSDNITDCTNTRCFPLPFVANATPSTLDAEFGTVSWLDCIKGHRFYPKYKRLRMNCANTGWWNPILSSCEPIYCGELSTVLNTDRSTDNRLYSTVVDYTCHKGHYYYPNMTSVVSIECMDDEQWNSTDIDPCWPIVCDLPPTIVNGSRQVPTNNNYSSIATYKCDPGHLFIDGASDRIIVCTENGNWNGTDVSCRVDRCSPVPLADNVIPNTRNTSWYTNVTFTCAIGHEWPNNKSTHHITCQNDGKWNDTDIPVCIIKKCDPVMSMPNATWNDTTHVYNTVVTYTADIGFKFEDNSTAKSRWCSDKPGWEPVVFPNCEIIYCPELEDVENATRNSNETYYNNHVRYECLPGYQYPDKSKIKTVVCTENETWTQYPPPCEVVFCPPVPWWTETDFNSTDNEFHAVVSYSCKTGYSFKDSLKIPNAVKTATCAESKTWIPAIDDCLAKESIAAELRGKTYESPDSVPIGTIAMAITCTVMGCIILLDMRKLFTDFKVMKSNIDSMIRYRKSQSQVSDSTTCINQDVDA